MRDQLHPATEHGRHVPACRPGGDWGAKSHFRHNLERDARVRHIAGMKRRDPTPALVPPFSWSRFMSSAVARTAGDGNQASALERWIDEEQFLAGFPSHVGEGWGWAWWRGGTPRP